MDFKLETKFNEWLTYDKNEETRKEMQVLHSCGNHEKLRELLMKRMAFGTAGLRAPMGPGYSQMNDLTIIQTTQGLLKYAQSQFNNLCTSGIVVGYDMRHNSKKWALYLANIFTSAGVVVYLFPDIIPTPLLAYGVSHFKACLGVMITASHNPKEDNGYKVYWFNGSQIIDPHDKGISKCIDENLIPLDSSWNIDNVKGHEKLRNPMPELMDKYCTLIAKGLSYKPTCEATCMQPAVYTAMHGVGWASVQRLCKTFNLPPLIPVIQQAEPDAEIPTVKYPNPEEGRSALDLAIATANKQDSKLIFANDPDADRLAVAEKQPNGEWKIFTGNEIGALFGWWIWSNWRRCNPTANASKVGMLSTTVSSSILKSMAQVEGFYYEETLTGFKWIGNRAHDLTKQGIKILFAFEEAIGFMCGDVVVDKDGVSALAVIYEMAIDAYGSGSSLQGRLDQVYQRYGQHISNNSYYFCHEPLKIVAMFNRIRHWPDSPSPAGYPTQLGRFSIVGVRDLTTGYDDAYPDKKARLPVSASSQNITFRFDNGVTLTIRTSGTEPKVKYYSELSAKPDISDRSADELEAELHELIDVMVEHFYQPKVNGFVARSS